MFVNPDESWSSKTEISGYDQQIFLGTFSLRPFQSSFSEITVENHSRSWKPETKPRSRRLWKIETRSGSQLDGISHPGPGLLLPHLLPGENEAQTRHMSKLSIPLGVPKYIFSPLLPFALMRETHVRLS